jgi:hypothetical protein
MADTKKLFDMASLAEAAYADFNDSNGGENAGKMGSGSIF